MVFKNVFKWFLPTILLSLIIVATVYVTYNNNNLYISGKTENTCNDKIAAFLLYANSLIYQNIGYAVALNVMLNKYDLQQWLFVNNLLKNYNAAVDNEFVGIYMYISNRSFLGFEKNISIMYNRNIKITEQCEHNLTMRYYVKNTRNFYVPCIIIFPYDPLHECIGADYMFYPNGAALINNVIETKRICSNDQYHSPDATSGLINVVIPVINEKIIGFVIFSLEYVTIFSMFANDGSFAFTIFNSNGDIVFGPNDSEMDNQFSVYKNIKFVNNTYRLLCVPTDKFVTSIKSQPLNVFMIIINCGYIISFLLISFIFKFKNEIVNKKIYTIRKINMLILHIFHEIRRNLYQIRNIINFTINDIDAKYVSDNYLFIQMSCDEAIRLIYDIVDFRKLMLMRFDMQPLPVCMRDIVDEINIKYQKMLSSSQVEWSSVCTMSQKTIFIDGVRIRQALCKLIDNSVKHCTNGFILMTVCESNDIMTIIISDTSVGINKSKLREIFDNYSLFDILSDFESAYISLIIAKQLIQLMNGKIILTFNGDMGVIFTIRIPIIYINKLKQLSSISVTTEIDDNIANSIAKSGFYLFRNVVLIENKNIFVMIVENNAIDQYIAIKILSMYQNISISIANSGKDAIDLFLTQSIKYDIIFINFQMPIMSGNAAAKRIRKLCNGANIVIIAMIAENVNVNEIKHLEYKNKFNGIIIKPFATKIVDNFIKYLCPTMYENNDKKNAELPNVNVLPLVNENSNEYCDE